MTLALIIYACVVTFGFVGVVHPRTRKLFLTAPKEEKVQLLLAGEGSALAEWKGIFRDTVISVDGGLTPEMEAFLVSDVEAKARERATAERLLVEARAQAKAELDELLDGEEDGDDERSLLVDGAVECNQFCDDYNLSTTAQEKLNVARRWSKKYKFNARIRTVLLKNSPGSTWRDAYREIFDEQDEDEG